MCVLLRGLVVGEKYRRNRVRGGKGRNGRVIERHCGVFNMPGEEAGNLTRIDLRLIIQGDNLLGGQGLAVRARGSTKKSW